MTKALTFKKILLISVILGIIITAITSFLIKSPTGCDHVFYGYPFPTHVKEIEREPALIHEGGVIGLGCSETVVQGLVPTIQAVTADTFFWGAVSLVILLIIKFVYKLSTKPKNHENPPQP